MTCLDLWAHACMQVGRQAGRQGPPSRGVAGVSPGRRSRGCPASARHLPWDSQGGGCVRLAPGPSTTGCAAGTHAQGIAARRACSAPARRRTEAVAVVEHEHPGAVVLDCADHRGQRVGARHVALLDEVAVVAVGKVLEGGGQPTGVSSSLDTRTALHYPTPQQRYHAGFIVELW